MAEITTPSRTDEMIESFRNRARANGRSFEDEVRQLLARKLPLTPEERVAVMTYNHAQYDHVQPSLTLDEIREGLM